jgi:predicted component of type VI protein secretion system
VVFKVCEHDIYFSLIYCGQFLSKNSEKETIIGERAKIDVDQRKFKHNVLAENTGVYKIVFDNTFSWFTKKLVFFNVTVL